MQVRGLDHINIRTDDVADTATFFRDALGLFIDSAPGSASVEDGCWAYDQSGHPIIHIGRSHMPYPSDATMPFEAAQGSGAIHHVALECDDISNAIARLQSLSVEYVRHDYASAGLSQLFLKEFNGIILELNFRSQPL